LKSGEEQQAKTVRAVERAVEILECFTTEQPLMSISDLQKKVKLSRPTLYRMLDSLAAKGLIRAIGKPQRYALNHGIAKLAQVWFANIDATQVALPMLQQLRDETNETVALVVVRGDKRLHVLELPSRHPLAISRGLGETEHLSLGASGKSILAYLPEAEVAAALRTAPRNVRVDELRQTLKQIRQDGVAVSRSEMIEGSVGVAAPVYDYTAGVIGSVVLSAPDVRIDAQRQAEFASLVRTAAAAISAELGYAGPPALQAPAPAPKSASRRAAKA
jgi:DNA-binding IclR family transcriptional regulator